ncbi:hypothetical protein FACS189490_05260 [Clostridia bacterium]|nr:hypothetical protein FACS189490_05260 [Clostridia bacterium]
MIISIGEFIKFFRKRHKLSQEQLAGILECTPKGLSKIENGMSSPRAYTVKLFEDHFKVKISRYYQSNAEMLPLSSYEMSMAMLTAVGSGNYKSAYGLACDFERSDYIKNKECHLNIHYVKARFFAAMACDYFEAVKNCAQGLTYEEYVYFYDDRDDRPLIVESFMPSAGSLQLINFLGICFVYLKEQNKATAIFEEALTALNKLLNEPNLISFCYSKEDVISPYTAFCNNLSHIYYEQKRYNDALDIADRGLSIIKRYGMSVFSGEHLYIKFKSLCSLHQYTEAMRILPDVLFLYKNIMDAKQFSELNDEFCEEFPKINNMINAVFSMFNTMLTMCSNA